MQIKAAQIDGLPGGGGGSGTRGGVFHKVTTAPSSYTTQYSGFTPSYRIAVSTVTSQGGHSDVIQGDVVWYSYYFYPVGRVGGGYAYLGARLSMRGATGATGGTGPSGPAGVRGSIWYAGTAISGTGVNNSVVSGSGIASPIVGDMYLNTVTGEVFACVLKGVPTVARWTYLMTLQGGSGGSGGSGGGTCNMPLPASFVAHLVTNNVEVGTPTGAGAPLSVGENPLGTPAASHNFYTVDSADIGGTDFYVYVNPMPTPYIRQRCVFINDGGADINIHIANSDSNLHTLITEYRNGYKLRGGDAVEFNFITVNGMREEGRENIYGNPEPFWSSRVRGVITTCTIECDDFGILKGKK